MFAAQKCSLVDQPKMDHSGTRHSLCSMQLPFARKWSESFYQVSYKCLMKKPHRYSSSTPVSDNMLSLPFFYHECSQKHDLMNACLDNVKIVPYLSSIVQRNFPGCTRPISEVSIKWITKKRHQGA